jgi:hypothetical protein
LTTNLSKKTGKEEDLLNQHKRGITVSVRAAEGDVRATREFHVEAPSLDVLREMAVIKFLQAIDDVQKGTHHREPELPDRQGEPMSPVSISDYAKAREAHDTVKEAQRAAKTGRSSGRIIR